MKTLLTQRCVERTSHLLGKTRLFDTELPGFMCEVSASGRKAFYVLVRDEYGRQRQKKIAESRGFTIHDHSLQIYVDCTKKPCPYRTKK